MGIAAWEEKYRNREFNDNGPIPLVVQFCKDLKPGRALDLACGAGRNALWLLDQGWEVKAVDSSTSALDLLRERSNSHARLTTRIANLENHEFNLGEQRWDLIVVSYYLQRDLLPLIAPALATGGIAIVIVHLTIADRRSHFSIELGELLRAFPDCTILHSHEGTPTGADTGRLVAEIVIRHE